MNKYRFTDLYEGQSVSFETEITLEMMKSFREISGDENPLHTDETFAKEQGYDDKVVYGMLSSSLLSKLVGVYLPGRYCLLQGLELKYLNPVYIKDVLTVKGTVVELHPSVQMAVIQALIIKQDGTLLMCGWNAKGQLGLGYDSGVESNPKELNFFDDGGNKIPVKQVTLGAYDTFFLLEDDTLWYAGRDMSGESCLGDDFSYSSTPVKVSDNVKLARIGDSFSTFVTKDDVQYLCGRGHSCTIPPSANNGKKISNWGYWRVFREKYNQIDMLE